MARWRSAAMALICAALAVGTQVQPSADAVILGEEAHRDDLVQLYIYDMGPGGAHRCSATAVADEWILTAAHCVAGQTPSAPDASPDILRVYYSNDSVHPGRALRVDKYAKSNEADLAIIHVPGSPRLTAYPPIADSHELQVGEQVSMYGFGQGFKGAPTTWLRTARLEVTGQERHPNAGIVMNMKGITGSSNFGDSGGPILDDSGVLIGVNVIGSQSNWYDPYAPSKAVDIQYYRDWIYQMSGV
ncbi:S1 family peptidase [Corynebacterium uberis]|uniref:S1 family peptidase n=1 Tax=Corynebacterium TaxID=1716 RepID=UPI001D0AC7D9|nr:S1 family peptidase [Corynebacterium uberis]MCZ9308681.1 S1 family peptidase [Corynebacterium sp. c6VSa_13]UDL74320.1 S1 family peptidase [Corynebacterium uberis]UDL76847.1 S1 family peptidase [Corynebacterium uberis]UDL79060.1 S1 family peptidase [Corynebacterium uberis]UDL79298.1 S1 family peptidase [Corynebacterium uberis]